MSLRDMARRLGTKWGPGLMCVVASLAAAVPAKTLGQNVPNEYQLKAVFLFNFAQFVEWPTSAFPEARTPLVIGVLGTDPFGAYLDETVRGEIVNSHPLAVQRYRRVEDITRCHILFVSGLEQGHLAEILAGLKGRTILTVGDAEGFTRGGGMIRFVTDHNRIRLRIN